MEKHFVEPEHEHESVSGESELFDNIFLVAPGVWRMKDQFVNIFLLQNTKNHEWVLVDTGLETSGSKIKKMIAEVIEPNAKPNAIILTHGHFDHRGSVKKLAEEWKVPVYAHHMELPYLSGKSDYPPADPTSGGGLMTSLSFSYPKKSINISDHLQELPEDGSIPGLKGWNWVHTPGHTPGHISLFRKKDRVLVAGDAFVTTKQESVYSVVTQQKEVNGPPRYFTPDWAEAAQSVRELEALKPHTIVSGHGQALYGVEAEKELHRLSIHFWETAVPANGRYVKEPAQFTEEGVSYIPPAPVNYPQLFVLAGAAALVAFGYFYFGNKQSESFWKKGMDNLFS